ncbi:MAG TPA: CapA family protein [Thermoanaerobaculia bacterium]
MDRRTFLKTVSGAAAAAAASRFLPEDAEAMPRRMTLMAVGDCLVSRRVSERRDPEFLELVELLRGADCTWGNCEVVLADTREVSPGYKQFDPHAICEPWGADELAWMGIGFVGTANNHILDFGYEGLFATLRNLERVGIAHAGSGVDLGAAARPAYYDTPAGRVGQVNCASTFPPYFAAGLAHPHLKGRPGLNPLQVSSAVQVPAKLFEEMRKAQATLVDLMGWGEFGDFVKELEERMPKGTSIFFEMTIASGDKVDILGQTSPLDVQRITDAIGTARNNSRMVIASIHSHEARRGLDFNDLFQEKFARACIDAGADCYVSSGPHVLRGVEIYKGKPIFYSLGNFLFQYETISPVPPEALAGLGLDPFTLDPSLYYKKIPYGEGRRFWESFVPRVTFEEGKVVEVELFPISLGFEEPAYHRGTPALAKGAEAQSILERIVRLSEPFGTKIDIQEGIGRIRLA